MGGLEGMLLILFRVLGFAASDFGSFQPDNQKP